MTQTHWNGGRSGMRSLNMRWARTMLLRSGMGLAALAISLFAGSALAWAGGAATEAIKGTINEVIRLLEDKDLKRPERREERRKLLEKVIGERFSYEEMAKRSLAAQWPKLNDGQKQEFVGLFQSLLSRTYSDKIESYSGEPVQYVNERNQEGYAEVRTKVISGKAEIPLDYRLMTKAGDWRVYDVVVDGISLVNNYRGQFTKIISSPGGYPELVETLRKKSEKIPAP
jgi:phospholipid transport system substrate-binding protein